MQINGYFFCEYICASPCASPRNQKRLIILKRGGLVDIINTSKFVGYRRL